MDIAVKMAGITMVFPNVIANDNVDLEVRRGEILALVGENGAGKTTLMNILYGLYQPKSGKVEIWGVEHKFQSAIDAINAGIGMVHQHFMLIPQLTNADNIVLGSEPRKKIQYLRDAAIKEVEALCNEYDIHIEAGALTSTISLGMQQRVEILKALYRKAGILIFDEPTAVLTPQEINEFGAMMKKLAEMGKTIIIITHKLKEVIDFSNRVTVLRRGKLIGTVITTQSSAEEITQMMVGRSVRLGGEKKPVEFEQKEVLRLENIHYHNGRIQKLKGVSFSVNSGEILGIAGIDNSGQKEITEIISGLIKPQEGRVLLDGKDITNLWVREIKKSGVGFIPQDRRKSGLALQMSAAMNLILGYQRNKKYIKRKIFLNKNNIREDGSGKMEQYDIRPNSPDAIVSNFSGGNQQKIVVAREMSNAKRLIIADQPSRGVDIGAIELIHRKIVEARNEGYAVLLVSLELDEVMMLSDRIAVIYDGQIMGVLDGNTATRERIGLLMAGGKINADQKTAV
jgi:simple sugar transport system ATP-binding protein